MPSVGPDAVAAAGELRSSVLAAVSGSRRALLVVRGEIGEPELAELIPRALSLAESGRPCLVLDLRRVTHWDYRCLPALWALAQRLRARGGDLRLCAPNRYLATILRFSGLEQLVEVHPSAPVALDSFRAIASRATVGPAKAGRAPRKRPVR